MLDGTLKWQDFTKSVLCNNKAGLWITLSVTTGLMYNTELQFRSTGSTRVIKREDNGTSVVRQVILEVVTPSISGWDQKTHSVIGYGISPVKKAVMFNSLKTPTKTLSLVTYKYSAHDREVTLSAIDTLIDTLIIVDITFKLVITSLTQDILSNMI